MERDPTGFAADAKSQMQQWGCSFSTSEELLAIAADLQPALACTAETPDEFAAWQQALRKRLTEILGPTPARVPLEPRIVEEVDCGDHLRQTVVYRASEQMSVPAYVLIPKDLPAARVPAVLTIHGHGYGACDLVGLSPEEESGGNAHRNYALDVVRRGMIAIAPDLRGFGRRAVDDDQLGVILRRLELPEARYFRRDMCNVHFLKASLLGYTMLGLQQHDLRCALDYLATRPDVDADRIGACGLSTGGMMTLFLAAKDERVKAAGISGTLTTYESYALRIETTCGTQLPPGILRYADLPDIACLIAPRPVCFETGRDDFGFLQEVAKGAFTRIARCYTMLGAPDAAILDAFDDGHVWHGTVSIPHMEQALKA